MPSLAKNKKTHFDYQILEEFEAGLELAGHEVKSVKAGHLSLKGAFVSVKNGQAWLKNMHITPYSKAGDKLKNHNPERERKLLLHKKEIEYLMGKSHSEGLTIVPISVYTTRRLVKVKIALAKGKKKFDKRADIKKRDIQKRLSHTMKTRYQ